MAVRSRLARRARLSVRGADAEPTASRGRAGRTSVAGLVRAGEGRLVLLTTSVALAARVAYLGLATGSTPLRSDAVQYHTLARNLAAGKGFAETFPQLQVHATAFRPPGYPAVLALFYMVFGPSAGLARGVNVGIGVLVVAFATLLAARHVGRRAAVGTGLALALSPNLIANDTWVATEPLSLLLILVGAWAVLERRVVVVALCVGALVLVRPSALSLPVLGLVWVVWRLGVKRAVVFAGVVAVVVAPWVVRNEVQLGSPLLVTSGGFNLAAMYGPPAQRTHTFVDPVYSSYYQPYRIYQFDEVAWDRKLREIGLDGVRAHPSQVGWVVRRNFLATFELRPSFNHGAEVNDGRNLRVRDATLWVFWLTAAVGLVGLWRGRRNLLVATLAVVAGAFQVASLFTVSPPRLRAPLDLALAFGVGVIVQGWGAAKRATTSLEKPTPAA